MVFAYDMDSQLRKAVHNCRVKLAKRARAAAGYGSDLESCVLGFQHSVAIYNVDKFTQAQYEIPHCTQIQIGIVVLDGEESDLSK